MGNVFSPDIFGIVRVFGIYWTVLDLFDSGDPIRLLDVGTSQVVL